MPFKSIFFVPFVTSSVPAAVVEAAASSVGPGAAAPSSLVAPFVAGAADALGEPPAAGLLALRI